MEVVITDFPSKKGGKQADVTLVFDGDDVLAGLKLTGFCIWNNSCTLGEDRVSFPGSRWKNKATQKMVTTIVLQEAGTGSEYTQFLEQLILEVYDVVKT